MTEFHEIALAEELARNLAKEAGEHIASAYRSSSITVNNKSINDLVTSADLEAEQIILKGIRETFPSHKILSEETSPELVHPEDFLEPLWIIDPIDGTINYAHGLPVVAVSVAFAHRGKVLVGVVEAPFLGETYHAVNGGGAYCNGKPIRVSTISDLNSALVAMGFPHCRRDTAHVLANQLRFMLLNCQDVRRAGAAAIDLCWVASGKMEFYFEDLNAWDIAAGALIVREAGGTTGNYESTPNNLFPDDFNPIRFFASNAALSERVREMLPKALLLDTP